MILKHISESIMTMISYMKILPF